jgi:hypothetical protein
MQEALFVGRTLASKHVPALLLQLLSTALTFGSDSQDWLPIFHIEHAGRSVGLGTHTATAATGAPEAVINS